MTRGRKPKPTALKVVEGTFRPDRAPRNEPRPRPLAPTCPRSLSPEARKLWRATLAELPDGVITRVDGPLLARWCEVTATAQRQGELVASVGPLIRGQRGTELVVNPAWRVYRQAAELQARLGEQLGLSPSARARVSVAGAAAADPGDLARRYLS